MEMIKKWLKPYFSDPQVIILLGLLLAVFAVIMLTGDYLASVFTSIIIAYLLESPVRRLERLGLPRFPAVLIVYVLFLVFLLMTIFRFIPLLSLQMSEAFGGVPDVVKDARTALATLPEKYPEWITPDQVQGLFTQAENKIAEWSTDLLSATEVLVQNLFEWGIFLVIMPLLVFFLLKDKHLFLAWFAGLLPSDTSLSKEVWGDVDRQIANYVRGKFLQIMLVGGLTFITFTIMGVTYAALLATLVGLSVLIPYVGAVIVTIPVLAFGYLQFGWTAEFGYVVIAYTVIQLVDGNIIIPLLYSEVVDLHPVAIIVAILFFGGIWGVAGAFFAIPLATLVHSVIKVVPERRRRAEGALAGETAA